MIHFDDRPSAVWYGEISALVVDRPGGAGPGSTWRFAGVAARPRHLRVSSEAGLRYRAPASASTTPCLPSDPQLLTREWVAPLVTVSQFHVSTES